MAEFSVKEILLSRDVNVLLAKTTNVNLRNITSTRNLHLCLELINLPGSAKELALQVTDDLDPSLLFTVVLSESDYHTLKVSQGLLVDFAIFPRHFCDLIKSCIQEQNKESPKFVLALRTDNDDDLSMTDGRVLLEIIEINVFKHLCHLSLSLAVASLPKKLSYLSSCIKKLKLNLATEKQSGNQEILHLKQEICSLKESLEKKQTENDKLREDYNLMLLNEKQDHVQLLSNEREKLLKIQSDSDRKSAREKRELENRYKDQIEEYSKKAATLSTKNKELVKIKEEQDKSLRELRRRYATNDEEMKKLKDELCYLRDLKVKLEHNVQSHINTVHMSEREIENLNIELESKTKALQKTSQEIMEVKEQMSVLKVSYEATQEKLKKRETSITHIFADLQKSLDVIRKLQANNKENKLVIDDYSNAYRELEKLLLDKDGEMKKLNEQNQENTTKLLTSEQHLKDTTEKLNEAKEKIAEQESTLKKNEQVISWLNKQLNEMEATGAIMKKAPLTDAYMPQQTQPMYNLQMAEPNLATSTPMSAANILPSFGKQSLSNVGPVRTVSKIPEEISQQIEENKENDVGLPEKYFEPIRKSNSVGGLLRKNAATKPAQPEAKRPSSVGNKTQNATRSNSNRGRGQKKVVTRPSNYFAN